jgi:tetratricopeptide (TPR) repeat protein
VERAVLSFHAPAARSLAVPLALCLLVTLVHGVQADEDGRTRVVQLLGSAEKRPQSRDPWVEARVRDELAGGSWFRTLSNSQASLLFPGRRAVTRVRQNSTIQVKTVEERQDFVKTTFRLNAGSAWSQARPRTAGDRAAEPADEPELSMETPTATLSIRGTAWLVEVGDNQTTRLYVTSGRVDISDVDRRGTLSIGAGEAAMVEKGRAPVRLQLVSPEERVQWVSSWRPRPAYWLDGEPGGYAAQMARIEAGEYQQTLDTLQDSAATDTAAAILAADLLVYAGRFDEAGNLLQPFAGAEPADARVAALLAAIRLRQGRSADARGVLERALQHRPDQALLLLGLGELAVVEGDAELARLCFRRVLDQDADNAQAWYGLGLVAAQRERIKQARALLRRAVESSPGLGAASIELAVVASMAGELEQAETRLNRILEQSPDDYLALTARGINRLKLGRPGQAIEDFVVAEAIEPRYARAKLYSAAAFYQRDERVWAEAALEDAQTLDPLDPLPYLYQSRIEGDARNYGAAIDAAREAQQRMPNLKSLNQVMVDRRGSANLGTSIAEFGMEEWARYYAYESYSPFWAGSHLFLADRYEGQFNKNSELYLGFIHDPLVFGASNRLSTLIKSPGHYLDLDLYHQRWDAEQNSAFLTASGVWVDPFSVSYFVSGDFGEADRLSSESAVSGTNFELAIGVVPRHDLKGFLFVSEFDADARFDEMVTPDSLAFRGRSRFDFGLSYVVRPGNELWLKVGKDDLDGNWSGSFRSEESAQALNALPGLPGTIDPLGEFERYDTEIAQNEAQVRHSMAIGESLWSWGIERSERDIEGSVSLLFDPVGFGFEEQQRLRSDEVYVEWGDEWTSDLSTVLAVSYQQFNLQRVDEDSFSIDGLSDKLFSKEQIDKWELLPRFGAKWRIDERRVIRTAAQRWRRPAGAATLASVDTVGIPLNDRLTLEGGRYERFRVQFDGEYPGRYFLQAFLDWERFFNEIVGSPSEVTDFDLTRLEQLLNRTEVFDSESTLEAVAPFEGGRLDSFGVALNGLIGERHSYSVAYLRRDGEQSGTQTGNAIPYVPKDFLRLEARTALPSRLLLGAGANYRSRRFSDALNERPIGAGWSLGFRGFWETPDRRHSFQVIVDNILPDNDAGLQPNTRYVAQYSLRI